MLWLASVNSTSDEDLASLKNNAVAKLSLFCKNQTLLDIALTHKSLISEGNLSMEETGSVTNERLEFLGDSVLSLVISTYLYGLYEDFPEGDLTRVRSQIVRTSSLAKAAKSFGLGFLIKLGKGEEASGGREKESILADALEAVIGAIYLDSGFVAAEKFTLSFFKRKITSEAKKPYLGDAKNRLQELTVSLGLGNPIYQVTGSGPEHKRLWRATVVVDGDKLSAGQGSSIRLAESAAAEKAWEKLRTNNTDWSPRKNVDH